MQHEFVELPAMQLTGLAVDCPGFDTSGIPPLWERFIPQIQGLEHRGVWGASLPAKDGFRYMAGLVLDAGASVPDGFSVEDIPGGKFLKVDFFDTPDKMPAAFQRIFHELLPALGESIKPGFLCLEEYLHDESDPGSGKLRVELYVQLL